MYENTETFNKLWKTGLSCHAYNNLNTRHIFGPDSFTFGDVNSSIIELAVEYERVILHPEIASRFQSFFLLPSLDCLNQWQQLLITDNPIYEVQYDTEVSSLHDAFYLRGGITNSGEFSPCMLIDFAEQYLSGKISETPQLEIYVPLPVTIGKCIGTTNSFIK
jgi:hypothetical protein